MNKHEQVIYITRCIYHCCLTVCTSGFSQDPIKHILMVQLLRPVTQMGIRTGESNTIDHPYPAAQVSFVTNSEVVHNIYLFLQSKVFYITVLKPFAQNQELCLSNLENTFSMYKEGNSSMITYLCTICSTQPQLIVGLFLDTPWSQYLITITGHFPFFGFCLMLWGSFVPLGPHYRKTRNSFLGTIR